MMKGIKYACFSVLSLALLSACSMNQSSESSMGNQPTMNTTTNKHPLVSMPELEKLVKDTDRDFEILTIMAPGLQGEKTEEEFVKWFDQQDYKSVPVLYNPDGSAFADYQVRSIPTEVFIDSHGKIGHVQLGAISNEDAKKIIKGLQ